MIDRNKYLTEAMGGRTDCKCTVDGEHDNHDDCWIISNPAERCCETPESHLPEDCKYWDHLYDFSTWQGFGKLWEWAQEQEWIDLFMCDTYYVNYDTPDEAAMDNDGYLHADYINPDRFANAVYEFLKGREA